MYINTGVNATSGKSYFRVEDMTKADLELLQTICRAASLFTVPRLRNFGIFAAERVTAALASIQRKESRYETGSFQE